MFCSQCGKQIDDAAICPYCGYGEDLSSPPTEQLSQDMLSQQEPQTPDPQLYQQPDQPTYQSDYQPAYQSDYQPTYQSDYQPTYQSGYQTDYQQASDNTAGSEYQSAYPEYPPVSPAMDTYAPQVGYDASVPYSANIPAAPQPEPKKKKRTGLVIGIIAATVVLLVGAGVLVFFLTAPARAYHHAMELKESGEYREAIEILAELEDYEDSADQITDCKYLAAKVTMSEGKYDKAIEEFTALKGYQDSDDLIDECYYLKAEGLMDEEDYSGARLLYMNLGDYKDCADKVQECDYQIALQDYEDGDYEKAAEAFEIFGDYKDSADMLTACKYQIAKSKIDDEPSDAIEMLEALGDYEDCKELIKDAKMSYCKKYSNNTNKTTYKYLTELKKAKYKGAAELYEELYAWRVENVFWNTSKTDTDIKSAMKKISNKKTACFHFRVLGGTPGEKTTLTYVASHSNGAGGTSTFTTNDNPDWTIYYDDLPTGTMTLTIKDKNGKQLAKASVTITS